MNPEIQCSYELVKFLARNSTKGSICRQLYRLNVIKMSFSKHFWWYFWGSSLGLELLLFNQRECCYDSLRISASSPFLHFTVSAQLYFVGEILSTNSNFRRKLWGSMLPVRGLVYFASISCLPFEESPDAFGNWWTHRISEASCLTDLKTGYLAFIFTSRAQ